MKGGRGPASTAMGLISRASTISRPSTLKAGGLSSAASKIVTWSFRQSQRCLPSQAGVRNSGGQDQADLLFQFAQRRITGRFAWTQAPAREVQAASVRLTHHQHALANPKRHQRTLVFRTQDAPPGPHGAEGNPVEGAERLVAGTAWPFPGGTMGQCGQAQAGRMSPRRRLRIQIRSAIPTAPPTASAGTEASGPKLPPVSHTLASGLGATCQKWPWKSVAETSAPKRKPCAKFQPAWAPMQTHRRPVSAKRALRPIPASR